MAWQRTEAKVCPKCAALHAEGMKFERPKPDPDGKFRLGKVLLAYDFMDKHGLDFADCVRLLATKGCIVYDVQQDFSTASYRFLVRHPSAPANIGQAFELSTLDIEFTDKEIRDWREIKETFGGGVILDSSVVEDPPWDTDCEETDVPTEKEECPCGGPKGHVPGGTRCRRS